MSASFDHYDANIAAGILATHTQITGLPGYLGISADGPFKANHYRY